MIWYRILTRSIGAMNVRDTTPCDSTCAHTWEIYVKRSCVPYNYSPSIHHASSQLHNPPLKGLRRQMRLLTATLPAIRYSCVASQIQVGRERHRSWARWRKTLSNQRVRESCVKSMHMSALKVTETQQLWLIYQHTAPIRLTSTFQSARNHSDRTTNARS